MKINENKVLVEVDFSDIDKNGVCAVPFGITKIDMEAFRNFPAHEIILPNTVTDIYGGSFMSCFNLECINLPNSIKSIGSYAFSSCSNLKSVVLPQNIHEIRVGTFAKCHKLKEIEIPDGVREIELLAFAYCENLASVVIPDSVQSIGKNAFEGCVSLKEIKINDLNILPGGIISRINDGDITIKPWEKDVFTPTKKDK